MSRKVAIGHIVREHFRTLRAPGSKRIDYVDLITFILLPIALALPWPLLSKALPADVSALMVNFGAIFTALLLSVLVLVYDQRSKHRDLPAASRDKTYSLKLELFNQLYSNICYAIIASVLLVALSLVHSLVYPLELAITPSASIGEISIRPAVVLTTPLVVFVSINLFLTVLMVVKRLHTLLSHEQ